MGIPLLAGRVFADSDTSQAPPVIVVNQTLARRFWPDGKSHWRAPGCWMPSTARVAEIVGVVGDVKPERIEGAGLAHHLHAPTRRRPSQP